MEKKKKIFQMNAYLNLHLTFIALLWIYSWFLQRLDLIKLQYFVKYVQEWENKFFDLEFQFELIALVN